MKCFTVIVATTAAILAGGMLSSNPARADFNGGGPVRNGNMCWAATTANDHGYWKECERPMRNMDRRDRRNRSDNRDNRDRDKR